MTYPAPTEASPLFQEVRAVLVRTLDLDIPLEELTPQTELLGSLPDLDSMSVVMVLTAMAEEFTFDLEDLELTGEAFATLGSLTAFVEAARASA